jgi:imidazolonepropionase-like amidohydrolase
MRKVTLIRGARQLLTLRGPSGPRRGTDLRNLAIIQDGAVLIADGLIAEVGPSRRLENLALARGAELIDASGCVVLPGLVDSHVDLVRGATQEVSPRALKTLALRVLEEAVRCGTTAMGAKSADLKILRVHSALRELPLTLVSMFDAAGLTLESDDRVLAMVRRRKLAEFAVDGAPRVDVMSPVIVTSPIAFHSDGERYPPARMLIDHGAAIALGSGVNPPNLQTTIALACNAMDMTPAEAIAAATINGAYAVQRAESIGSIEAGKSADLTILGVPDYRELPYHFGVNLVKLVMIRGAVLVERSEVKWPAR